MIITIYSLCSTRPKVRSTQWVVNWSSKTGLLSIVFIYSSVIRWQCRFHVRHRAGTPGPGLKIDQPPQQVVALASVLLPISLFSAVLRYCSCFRDRAPKYFFSYTLFADRDSSGRFQQYKFRRNIIFFSKRSLCDTRPKV